jgi:hypothetical protein
MSNTIEIPTETEVTEDYIKASVWVKRGNMIVQRDCLARRFAEKNL